VNDYLFIALASILQDYELVRGKFDCEYRGEIDAKNKGKLKMYYVGY